MFDDLPVLEACHRHFPDKREVLFDGEADFRASVTATLADVPDDIGPLEVLLRCLPAAGRLLEDNRDISEPRSHVIAATPVLRERALLKGAWLADPSRRLDAHLTQAFADLRALAGRGP